MGRVRLGCEVNQPCATTKEVGEESSNLEDVEEAEGSRESCDLVVLDRIAKWSRIVANGLEGEIEVVIVTTGSFLLDVPVTGLFVSWRCWSKAPTSLFFAYRYWANSISPKYARDKIRSDLSAGGHQPFCSSVVNYHRIATRIAHFVQFDRERLTCKYCRQWDL